jgi:hypothetical protein
MKRGQRTENTSEIADSRTYSAHYENVLIHNILLRNVPSTISSTVPKWCGVSATALQVVNPDFIRNPPLTLSLSPVGRGEGDECSHTPSEKRIRR